LIIIVPAGLTLSNKSEAAEFTALTLIPDIVIVLRGPDSLSLSASLRVTVMVVAVILILAVTVSSPPPSKSIEPMPGSNSNLEATVGSMVNVPSVPVIPVKSSTLFSEITISESVTYDASPTHMAGATPPEKETWAAELTEKSRKPERRAIVKGFR
jgi:hypothetical protein